MLSSRTKPHWTFKSIKKISNEAKQGYGWEAVGQPMRSQNICLHLLLLSAQLSGRASYAQIYTEYAAQQQI